MSEGKTGPDKTLASIVCFGPFELDIRAEELRKHGIKVRLHQQPFRILLMLLGRPGEVVLRTEIRNELWPNDTVVEFDHGINGAIQRLRDALGDTADKPRYVETVPRRGYRFIGTLVSSQPAQPHESPQSARESDLDPTDLSGVTFSHFRVMEELGRGGLAVVYRAEDLKLGRQVALKVLPFASPEGSLLVERFRREACAASSLNHPNICTIYGVEECVGHPVIVMELLEGETLAGRVARGTLPFEKALPLATQMAGALAEAHRKGVVHGDLKPANIMLTKSGAKVLDFGLVKVGGFETAGALPDTHYISPEQAQGKDADARSDIFSFGCILLEMLTGQRAFTGDTAAEVMSAILTEDPLERAAAAPLPPVLSRIVRHCLEKRPEERFQSAHDLVFDLEAVAVSSATPVARPLWRTIAAAACAVIALAGAWWAGRQFAAGSARFERLTFNRGFIQGARFTPDGRSVVYAASSRGQPPELFSIQPGTAESRALGPPSAGLLSIASTGEMAVSTDCYLSLFKSVGTLAQLPLAGGTPRELRERVIAADWAPDGKRLAIITAQAKAQPSRLEFPLGQTLFQSSGSGWMNYVRVSPHGDLVAFADHFDSSDGAFVAVVDLKGRKRRLTGLFITLQGLAWSPDGKEIWFAGAPEGSTDRKLYAVTPSGGSRLVADIPVDLKLHDVAPDGRVLLAREQWQPTVYFLGPGESSPHDLTWLDWATHPILSEDGNTLIMTENRAGSNWYMTYLRQTDGSPAMRLGPGFGASISPDGKWVITTHPKEGRPQLTLLPVKAGTPVPIRTGSLDLGESAPQDIPTVIWSPDSQRILFSAKEVGHGLRTYVLDVRGGPPRPVTPEGISGAALTPDGAVLLAYDSQAKAFLVPLNGGPLKAATFLSPQYEVLRFADSRSLYVLKRGERPPRIWRLDLVTGLVGLWREIPPEKPVGITGVGAFQISADGRSLAYVRYTAASELYLARGLR